MRKTIQCTNPAMMVKSVLTISVCLVLSACAVGPDFKSPEAPVTSEEYSYTATPISEETQVSEGKAGTSQKLIRGQDISAQWWEIFHSKELDDLIRTALANSPDLASAQAALRQAQENYNALWGSTLFPSLTANYTPERDKAAQGLSVGSEGRLYTLSTGNVSVSYTFDIFGENRRAREDLQAEVEYQKFQVEAAYLTLTSNLVATAISEASLRAQLEAQKEILAAQVKQLSVIESQFIVGAIKKVDVLNQQILVAQTRAAIPPLEKQLQQTRHQLAVLSGRLPSDAGIPEFSLDKLELPQELPVSVPSALVRQRPDIRASEAKLHRASAQIGVATAKRLPQLTLSAFYGTSSLNAGSIFSSSMFTSATETWRLAGNVTATIFDAGALAAKRRAAIAYYDQQEALYRSTVLGAFKNVADTLQALDNDAKTLKEQVNVVNAANKNLELANLQFSYGAISSLTLLDVKRTYQQARIGLVQAQAARYADTAALFQALGGGWWNREELKDISIKEEQ